MRFGLTIATAGLAAMLGTATAEAAPMVVAPLGTAPATTPLTPQKAVQSGPAAKLILVRGGCGYGAHLTYSGRCHLNYGWRGRVRARHRWYRHHWRRW